MAEVTGLGPLEPLLRDETITEVMVNGPDHIYIERKGKIERVANSFLNDDHVLRIIDRIITPLGRRIDQTSPRVDARLPDGSRVNCVIEPLSLIGPVITVRKFSARPYTVADLVGFGTASSEMFEFLRACVEARLNIFVSGGTGSGKTTTLNVISAFIPEEERIITIEDAAELQLRQEHVITLEARPPNLEGLGEITTRDLLRNSLHMRPDRIIVGECRAGEALDMIQAMIGRPGGVPVDGPRQQLARHAPPPRDDDPDGRLRDAAADDPRADRLGGRPDRAHRPPRRRLAQGRQHHRDLRDRGRPDPHPGHLRVPPDRRRRGRQDRGRPAPDRRPPHVHAQVRGERHRAAAGRVRDPGGGPLEAGPAADRQGAVDRHRLRRVAAADVRAGADGRVGRDGLHLVGGAGRAGDGAARRARPSAARPQQCLENLQARLDRGRVVAGQDRVGQLVAQGHGRLGDLQRGVGPLVPGRRAGGPAHADAAAAPAGRVPGRQSA